jgi:hypothetical protein
MWWIKAKRAEYAGDYESWKDYGVHPTVNQFDVGDIRSVVIVEVNVDETGAVVLQDREGSPGGGKGPLPSTELSFSLRTSNFQVLFQDVEEEVVALPIQDGRGFDKKQNGLGLGEQGDPSYTLDTTGGQSVFAIQNTVIGRQDHNGPQGKGYGDEDDPMFTLDLSSPHAVAAPTVVRRLTPTECERLQGFPDGWTEEQSDTHRYKQMGNAVTVNVVAWVGHAIMEAENYGRETSDKTSP